MRSGEREYYSIDARGLALKVQLLTRLPLAYHQKISKNAVFQDDTLAT